MPINLQMAKSIDRPKSSEGWVDTKISNVRVDKCKHVYTRSAMPNQAWEQIKRSLIDTQPYYDLTESKKARLLLIISDSLILVV